MSFYLPMSKKMNHTAEPFKLTVFRSFEEMKSAPVSFRSAKPLAQRKAEHKEAFDQLRSAFSANNGPHLQKPNKKTLT
jgi:hypothetical protein